ncbi:unnamed protein product [Adineta ricciae]|uniref:peptidylglycine monooxygenase n=1 Tax=Adineta ricciae TaxID=249248 RepID=A0A815L4N7_ADIRI|nr:unnamed protein product [Adineta ricciae]
MKNVTTKEGDQQVYIQYKLPDEKLMIIDFKPLVNMNTAHHILTLACVTPTSNESIWFDGTACRNKQMIIYDWSRNGSSLALPKDTGFVVGHNTSYKYLVMNIHYLPIITNDNSGIQILFTRKMRKYHAGMFLAGTSNITLPPRTQDIRTPFSCRYLGPTISIFALHYHTHQWGRVSSIYRVRNKTILQIGKSNPQWPQSFYPLSSSIQIEKNDFIIGQCVYDNNDDRIINIGQRHDDEMCNIYAMYSYEPTVLNNNKWEGFNPLIEFCWGEYSGNITRLIPSDSVIIPDKPYTIEQIQKNNDIHMKHTIESSTRDTYTGVENWSTIRFLLTDLKHLQAITINKTKLYFFLIICLIIFLSILGFLIVYHVAVYSNWNYRYKGFHRLTQNEEEDKSQDVCVNCVI